MNRVLDLIFPSRIWIREQERVLGNSLDGVRYTKSQYLSAYDLVVDHLRRSGYTRIRANAMEVVGAIDGFAVDPAGKEVDFEYYMRDLVLGNIREDGGDDYRIAVNRAKVAGENGL